MTGLPIHNLFKPHHEVNKLQAAFRTQRPLIGLGIDMAQAASAISPAADVPHANPAKISAVTARDTGPCWSVMIPTFNCARFLPQALQSVLTQDPGSDSMQIQVVDDCSTDTDVETLVREIGCGRVAFFRQSKNVGHVENFNTCLRRSTGKWVHLLHGDDFVRPGFYARMRHAFHSHPDIGAAFCRSVFTDASGAELGVTPLAQPDSGLLNDAAVHIASEQRIMTPSIVVRRQVYERLGGFDHRLVCSEDWEMWVRIAAHYPIWYEAEPLAVYRMHSESNTGRHMRSGDDIRYTCVAINMFCRYLPADRAASVAARARETYALEALRSAEKFVADGDFTAAIAQVRAALGCRWSAKVGKRIFRLLVHRARFALTGSRDRLD